MAFNFSKFLTNSATQAATEFAKGMDSKTVAAAAFSGLTKVGEQVAIQLAKGLAQGASQYVDQKLGNDTTWTKLGNTLADTLLKQVQQAATVRIQQGGQQVRQMGANALQTPVGTSQPPPQYGPAIPSSQQYFDQQREAMRAYEASVRRMRHPGTPENPNPLVAQPGYNIGTDYRHGHGQVFSNLPQEESAPAETAQARGRVPYSRQVSSFFGGGGGHGGGDVLSAIKFFTVDYGIKSLISGVTSSLQTVNQLVQQAGQLQKTTGSTAPAQSFYHNVGSATMGLGYLPQDMLAAASVYMPAARTSSPYDITQIARFGNSYGLDPTQWAAQMAQAAGQLGYVGGAQGSMGLSAYQGLLASAYASSSGLAKMPDFTTGWQDLARLMQANTVTSPNPSGPNSALQFYVRLNQSKIAGESGTSAGALLGQLNQGIVNGPTSGSPGVQMAYYQALGGTKGISPAQLQWETEQGLSGPAFKDIISYANKVYAGFSPMDKRYAESKLLGLNEHQTKAVLDAYGNGGAAFSMQGLNSLLKGAGTSLNSVNDSQLNLLAQLAGGKSTSVIAQEMAQQHIKGVKGLYVPVNGDTRHMMLNPNVSRQQLADLIVKGGTPESEADKQRKAANALAQQMQIAATQVEGFWRALQNSLAQIMAWINKHILPPLDPVLEQHPLASAVTIGVGGAVGTATALWGAKTAASKLYRKVTGQKSTSERLSRLEQRASEARLTGKDTPLVAREDMGVGDVGLYPLDPELDPKQVEAQRYLARTESSLEAGRDHVGPEGGALGAAVALGSIMNLAEQASLRGQKFPGYHWVNNPWGSNPILGALLGSRSLARNGQGWNLGDFLAPHAAAGSPVNSWGIPGITTGTGGAVPLHRTMPGWSTALGAMHRVPGGKHGTGGGTGLTPALLQKEEQAAQSYRATLGDTYYQHLKASNKTSEGVVGRALNTSTPLDTTTLRTLTTQLAKFINAFGKQLTDWTQSSFNAALSTANPGSTGSGSSGGPGSGAGGTLKNFVYTPGGKGVTSPLHGNFSLNQPYGGHLSAEPSGYQYADGSIGYVWQPGAKYYSHLHNGIDLGTPMGTPIYAGYAGKINEGWDKTGFGNKVTLDNGKYTELFGHLSRYAVKNGTMVKQGQLIGYTGSSGNSTGPHLHFSVEDDKTGDFIDPTAFYRGTAGTGVSAAMVAGSGSSGSSKLWNAILNKVPAQYKKLYQKVGAITGVPWQFLAMQGYKESGWNPNAVSPDGGYGIAQFTGATGYDYLGGAGWQQRAEDPLAAIPAQGAYMQDLLKREHGNLWAAARDYNGAGPKAIQYANSLMGMLGVSGQSYMLSNGVGGGGAGVQPIPIQGEITLHLIYPNGHKQDVKVPVRPKFGGVVGIHVEPMPTQHGTVAHPASRAAIKR